MAEIRRMTAILQRNATQADLEAAEERYTGKLVQVPGKAERYRCIHVCLESSTRRLLADLTLEEELVPQLLPAELPRGLAALSPERRREIAAMGGRSNGVLAAQSPERRREIAAMGARALHATGLAHRWTAEEAAEAGRKGGSAPRKPARTKEAS